MDLLVSFFFLKNSFLKKKHSVDTLFLNDKSKMENIIKAQKQNIDKNACSKICEFIIDEIRKYSK